jgi:hypothetical protein
MNLNKKVHSKILIIQRDKKLRKDLTLHQINKPLNR